MREPKQYSQELLERAVDLVRSQTVSQHGASKAFGIPRSTLNGEILGKSPVMKQIKVVLSDEEEERLVHWIFKMSQRGFIHTQEDIKDMVKALLDKRGAETVFRDNRPGKQWMAAFLLRHKEISEMMIAQASSPSEQVHESVASLQEWFAELERCVNSLDPTLFYQRDRVFYVHLAVFSICPKTKKILAPVRASNISLMSSSSVSGTHITVLACFSAAGEYLFPLPIFPDQKYQKFYPLEGFDKVFYQRTKDGRFSPEIFHTWIRDLFIPAVDDMSKPVILYVDCNASHVMSVETCELCEAKSILLYCLKPHSFYTKESLDKEFFDAVSRAWFEAVCRFELDTGRVVTMQTFARVLLESWKEASNLEIAASCFKRSGLFPFDPSAVISSEQANATCDFITSPLDHSQNSKLPESFYEKLNIFEDLMKMGLEANLRNVKMMREGSNNIADTDFSKWRDLVLTLFGTSISSGSEESFSHTVEEPAEQKLDALTLFEPKDMENKERKRKLDCERRKRESEGQRKKKR